MKFGFVLDPKKINFIDFTDENVQAYIENMAEADRGIYVPSTENMLRGEDNHVVGAEQATYKQVQVDELCVRNEDEAFTLVNDLKK